MKSLIPALFTVGALMVLFGAAVYITGWEPAPYVYTIGATMVALAQINSPSKSNRANVKRLRRQQIFGALLLVLTGVFMFFMKVVQINWEEKKELVESGEIDCIMGCFFYGRTS